MIEWDDVVHALENPKYKWRTVRGVAKRVKGSEDEVLQVLNEHANEIIRSSIPAESGEDLYTTRRHYKRMTPFFDKVLSSLTGTVVSSTSSSASSSSSSSGGSLDSNHSEEK